MQSCTPANPLLGTETLGALGLGTVPAVFLTGTAFDGLDIDSRQRLHRGLGVAFVVLGYIPLQHGLAALGIAIPAVMTGLTPW